MMRLRHAALILGVFGMTMQQAGADTPALPRPISFVRDVIPVLTKAGCNSGSCHGSFQGRGGLRLSLLGFDPLGDYHALVLEDRGRRVMPASPDNSLFLLKPAGRMAHGGGMKLDAASEGYRIVRDWIAQGLSAPSANDPHVARLELSHGEEFLAAGKSIDVRVQAIWSDGGKQEATRWAHFESTNDRVAGVDAQGRIKTVAPGRAGIMVRYHGQVATVTITVPYAAAATDTPAKSDNFIDRFVQAEWHKLGLEPAPAADDAEFLRRVYVDLVGSLPTPQEVRDFLAAKEADKRARVIERLLSRPEYVDYWSLKWGDLLRAHNRALGEKGIKSFSAWLRQALRENRPVDQLVRELILAQGNLYTSGPVAFYFVDKTPEDLAETTAQIFLGVRMQCAKCHHHPFEVWSQEDYYGLAAFFTRVERKDTLEGGRFGGAQSVRVKALGQVLHPLTGKVVPPRLLGAANKAENETGDPRQPLAEWITAKDNPYFARNIVNRYWGYLFGRGLIEPIDDMRATNPPSHPELLDALARDFVAHDFDLKHLLRTLCNTRVYQLASVLKPARDEEGVFLTHHRPRRMPAEVLLDALNQATEAEEAFKNHPLGTRAIALLDPSVTSSFLDTFGRPLRTTTCECERGNKPDLSQVLLMANGLQVHDKVVAEKGRVARLLKTVKDDTAIIEELYLATVSRLPTAAEATTVRNLLMRAPSRKEGFEDLLWTLVNCSEFMFNH